MFTKARLTLTAWYLLIIMLISIFFSAIIYRVITQEVERFASMQRTRIERRIQDQVFFPGPPSVNLHTQISMLDPDLVGETKKRVLLILIIINGGIAIIAGGLGYVLSGKTLQPIALMLEEQHRFISDASHELRTPLAGLKSNIEVTLRNNKLSLQEAKTALVESLDDVNNLTQLSNNLLFLSSMESQDSKNSFSTISTSNLITNAIRSVSALAKQKKIRITKNIEDVSFQGNLQNLQDLCITLFDNAIKYSHQNGSITISCTETPKDLVIQVQDHGIGISEKDLPYIYDRFYRANTARSKQGTNGYGLGLAIAKRIVNRHHGTITVESRLNKGTTFSITLPKQQPG